MGLTPDAVLSLISDSRSFKNPGSLLRANIGIMGLQSALLQGCCKMTEDREKTPFQIRQSHLLTQNRFTFYDSPSHSQSQSLKVSPSQI